MACVLVGYDFTDGAVGALNEARRLAALLDARLEVVYVREGHSGLRWEDDPRALAQLAAVDLDPADLVTRLGLPWVEVARRATEAHAAFVVVGSHGHSGYQPLTLGANALKLALQAPCPVLLVGPRALRRVPQRV